MMMMMMTTMAMSVKRPLIYLLQLEWLRPDRAWTGRVVSFGLRSDPPVVLRCAHAHSSVRNIELSSSGAAADYRKFVLGSANCFIFEFCYSAMCENCYFCDLWGNINIHCWLNLKIIYFLTQLKAVAIKGIYFKNGHCGISFAAIIFSFQSGWKGEIRLSQNSSNYHSACVNQGKCYIVGSFNWILQEGCALIRKSI